MKKIISKAAVFAYILSTVCFVGMYSGEAAEVTGRQQAREEKKVSATDLGVMCISTVYPSMGIEMADSRDNEEASASGEDRGKTESLVVSDEGEDGITITGDDPTVLIIHTHATESYLPEAGSNYHSKGEVNTVRDVGNTLTASLEKEGIHVVHDKTLHDDPSYNNSYYRSYDTVEKLLAKYPTIQCVIDLHRDAVSSDQAAATVSVKGKTCARYSYVVGTSASTYSSNTAFISSLNARAQEEYQGFTGKVLERGYRYNQDLSSRYLLLEVGYNRNQIEDARNTAEIFGKILADTLKEG